MGFDTFRDEPKSYLQTHTVLIQQHPVVMTPLTATPPAGIPTGGTAQRFTHNTGQFVTMVHSYPLGATATVAAEKKWYNVVGRELGVRPKASRTFTAIPSAVDTGLRFLPYNPGHVTYMPMDAAATFAITGPLTGCTVAAGETPAGVVYFFHSFTHGLLEGVLARTAQRQMISYVQAQLGIHLCHIAENTVHYDGQGFAFGRLRHGAWKFYVYGTASGLAKFAEL